MADIAFVRKVLEFVENEHSDFAHEQGTFIMTPQLAEGFWGVTGDGDANTFLGNHHGPVGFRRRFGVDCKTAACIAGTACLLDPDTKVNREGMPEVNGQQVDWSRHAAGLLGLTDGGADLFWEMNNTVAIEKLRNHLHNLEMADA